MRYGGQIEKSWHFEDPIFDQNCNTIHTIDTDTSVVQVKTKEIISTQPRPSIYLLNNINVKWV